MTPDKPLKGPVRQTLEPKKPEAQCFYCSGPIKEKDKIVHVLERGDSVPAHEKCYWDNKKMDDKKEREKNEKFKG